MRLLSCTLVRLAVFRLVALPLVALPLVALPLAAQDRDSWVISQITTQNAGLSSGLRTEKYQQMDASPFVFYRGTDHLFWADQGLSSDLTTFGNLSTTRIWLQGDLHTDNFGAFDNDAGTVVYDLNDFDETVIADYQLDVWRMAVSLVLVARQNGFNDTDAATFVDSFTEHYLDGVEAFVGTSAETTKAFTVSNTYGQLDDFLSDTTSSDSRVKMLDKWAPKSGGVRAFNPATNSDLAAVNASTTTAIKAALGSATYGVTLSGGLGWSSSYFKVKSVAQRLHAGVGSLGTTRYYVLIDGKTTGQDDDRILDVKAQAAPSAWGRIASAAQSATTTASGGNQAKRTVVAYKSLGVKVDDHLGWTSINSQAFSVRERSPYKETLDVAVLNSFDRMTKLAEQWGDILSAAHCRADQDSAGSGITTSFENAVNAEINGWHSEFRTLVRAKSVGYANQVESDYAAYVAWRLAGGG
jgi:uncharacterized protein (DUF2252 family)